MPIAQEIRNESDEFFLLPD